MNPPAMKTPTLSTVYLDNERIGLMGDPKPLVSKIVAAGGKAPEAVQVLRGKSATDTHGQPLRLWDTVDRTEKPETPIYLTCKPKPAGPSIAGNLEPPSATGGRKIPP